MFAPVGVLAGWIAMRLGASHSVGAGWVAAHALSLTGWLLFGPVIAGLRRRGRPSALIGAAVAAAGLVAVVGQMIVDIIVGIAAADRAQMQENFNQAYDIPGVRVVLYGFGPVLLFAGLAALFVQLAVQRRIPRGTMFLALLGILMIGLDGVVGSTARLVVMPLGLLCVWLTLDRLRPQESF